MASRLEAGYVSLNGVAALPASAPFGGYRMSGYGKVGRPRGAGRVPPVEDVYLAME